MKRLLLLLLCISVMLGATGCNTADKAEDAFNGFMITVGICDFESALNFVDEDKYKDAFATYIEYQTYLAKFIDDMTYEIVSSKEIDANTVDLTVKVTAIEMKPILQTLYNEIAKLISNAKFKDEWEAEDTATARVERLLGRISTGSTLATFTREVSIKVVKKDDKWLVEPNSEFMAAVTGDLEKALDELNNPPAETAESTTPTGETAAQ